MKITKRIASIVAALTILGAYPIFANAKGWEQQKTERTDARPAAKWADTEIKTVRGAIIIHTSTRMQIKVFTILGQLVSNETLTPGIWQLNMPARGVYIIKANDMTCKVAV